jgi:hypothetical protein
MLVEHIGALSTYLGGLCPSDELLSLLRYGHQNGRCGLIRTQTDMDRRAAVFLFQRRELRGEAVTVERADSRKSMHVLRIVLILTCNSFTAGWDGF